MTGNAMREDAQIGICGLEPLELQELRKELQNPIILGVNDDSIHGASNELVLLAAATAPAISTIASWLVRRRHKENIDLEILIIHQDGRQERKTFSYRLDKSTPGRQQEALSKALLEKVERLLKEQEEGE